jgi:hypothetical protein
MSLTLVGLLGTLFNIHLGNWFREILALRAKWAANEGNTDFELQARLECRYVLPGLCNATPLLTSVALSAFIGLVTAVAVKLLVPQLSSDPVAGDFLKVYVAFLVVYTVLSSYFLGRGYLFLLQLRSAVDAKFRL